VNDTAPIVGSIVRTTRDTALTPRNFTEAMELSKLLATSDMIPPGYRGKPANIMLAIQWGGEIGLSPLQAIQSVSNINGKFAVYGDALLAIVRGSPLCDDVIETFEGTGENLTAVCVAHRRGSAPVTHRFSVADAKKARLWGKAGPWSEYPKRMLQWRARGFALRDAFPDALRGIVTVEEARDIPSRDMVDVTPPTDVTADLDSFADVPDSPPVDGQVADKPVDETDALDAEAKKRAGLGRDPFLAWWKGLSRTARDLIRDRMPEYQALAEAAAAPADKPEEDPFNLPPIKEAGTRDEDWWMQPHLVIEEAAPIAFQARMEQRLAEARTVGEVTALREDNDAIDELPQAIKEAVLTALLAREAELRSVAPS
jgi:hypothetical protein